MGRSPQDRDWEEVYGSWAMLVSSHGTRLAQCCPGQDKEQRQTLPTPISLALPTPFKRPLQAEQGGKLKQTHVGLGTGGLDTQAIRKSFFLLDFPKMGRRRGFWLVLQSSNVPWARQSWGQR
jgi:hypothetical protein